MTPVSLMQTIVHGIHVACYTNPVVITGYVAMDDGLTGYESRVNRPKGDRDMGHGGQNGEGWGQGVKGVRLSHGNIVHILP